MIASLFIGLVCAIVGAIIGAYLQRLWTPDPAKEVRSLREQVASLSEQVAAFQRQTETIDKERAELEHFSFVFSLQQGNFRDYTAIAKNKSDYRVSIEAIQILRGDTNYESPLTEPVKPTPKHDWTLEPSASKTICWSSQNDPISLLRTLERGSDPNFPNGRVIPLTFLLFLKAKGKPVKKTCTQQVSFQGNQILPWGV